jgi:hypothetical protein
MCETDMRVAIHRPPPAARPPAAPARRPGPPPTADDEACLCSRDAPALARRGNYPHGG